MYSSYMLHNLSPHRSHQLYPDRYLRPSPETPEHIHRTRSPHRSPHRYPQQSPQRLPQRSPQRSPQRFPNLSQFYSTSIDNEYEDPITPRRDDDDTILLDPTNPYNPSPYNSISRTFGLQPNWSRRNSHRDGDTYYYNELSGQTQWEQPLNQEQRNALDELMHILNMELERRVALRRNP